MQLGFWGGTGIEGRGLALRFAQAGASVCIGSRDEDRAVAYARKYNELLGEALITGLHNQRMLNTCEIIFLTVPFPVAAETIQSVGSDLKVDQIVVDVTVPMSFAQGRADYLAWDLKSGSEYLASHLPSGVPLVAAFKTIPAHLLADLGSALDCDIFVCADSGEAKKRVVQVAKMIPGLRPLDAGPLSSAGTIERMTILAVNLNLTYKKKNARFRVEGL